ncbi:hypothetical protein AERO8C_140200 [Aeromonas veronii]|uniref:Uncharacterized protein n=1 Tax=Aeromonas veronii TaxID=654 RepID=A0A653KVG9_AERVE|nr:hypothetical protein AERO8C_140200 [Aeromonas veronii]
MSNERAIAHLLLGLFCLQEVCHKQIAQIDGLGMSTLQTENDRSISCPESDGIIWPP